MRGNIRLKGGINVRDLLPTWRQAPGGNVISDCPWCGKVGKLYVQSGEDSVSTKTGRPNYGNFDCKSCGRFGGPYKLLIALGRADLLLGQTYDRSAKLEPSILLDDGVVEALKPLPVVRMPAGFERVTEDDYLDARGLTPDHYRKYACGRDRMTLRPDDYVFVGIPQDGRLRAYVKRRVTNDDRLLRYDNSRSDFARVLTGGDEIQFFTTHVIVTEGFFDKVAVDAALGLAGDPSVKCCALNGKAISESQLQRILSNPSVTKLTLALDPDAIQHARDLACAMMLKFDEVSVAYLRGYKDFGEAPPKAISDTIRGATPIGRFRRKVITTKI